MRWFKGRESTPAQQRPSPDSAQQPSATAGPSTDKADAPLSAPNASLDSAGGASHAGIPGSSPADERRLHIVFRGEVQGVGFRWNSMHVANDLGLRGWVRNEWDGSVTMELQGADDQIARFFTEFNKQYQRFRINYVIDEKEDIPLRDDEGDFQVVFH